MPSLQLQKREVSTHLPDLVEERRQCPDFSLVVTALHSDRPGARKNWIAPVIFMQVARVSIMFGALISGIIAILLVIRGVL